MNSNKEKIVNILDSEYCRKAILVQEVLQNNFAYNYIITDRNGKKYYYRYCDDQKNIGISLRDVYKIHNQFHGSGFYIPKWFCTLKNEITSSFNGVDHYCLLEMLDITRKPFMPVKVAESLAELHRYLQSVSELSSNLSLIDIVSNTKKVYYKNIPNKILLVMNKSLKKLDQLDLISQFQKLPHQLIHGDFHKNNVSLTKHFMYVFDFFNSTLDSRIFDLSEAMDLFDNKIDKKLFLKSYILNFPLTLNEIDLLPYCKIIKNIVFLSQILENYRFNIRLRGAKKTVNDALNVLSTFV